MNGISIEVLSATHPRKDFCCGVPVLDRYLAELASQDVKRRVSNCFVAISDGAVAGYYTFAATSVPLNDLPPDDTRRLPRYALLPAGLIGRLAVDLRFKGQGVGGALIMDAVRRSVQADPAIFALLVDAKDESAVRFYGHLGFRQCASRPMTMYLPIATALRALEAAHEK